MQKERKPIPFQVIDETVLTNKLRVLVDGIDISQFQKNPVMLFDHNDYALPMGRWENVRKENGMILADAVFDYDDDDDLVKRIISKVERGFLKACTAGLVDLEASSDPLLMLPGQDGPTITKCRLREISITPVGRNHNGLKLYDKEGALIELSEATDTRLLLSDFIVSPKISTNMSKKYLELLNLSDKATDVEIDARVELLLSDKRKAESDLLEEKKKSAKVQKELEDLQLADKTEKRDAFAKEVDAAIKGGRIDEKADGSVKSSYLNLFDKDTEAARTALGALPKPKSLSEMNLGDKETKECKELEAMDYGAMDKAGKALLCRDKYPDLFKEKYRAKFGKEPVMPA